MHSLPSMPRRTAPATFESLKQLVAATKRIQDARLHSRWHASVDTTHVRLRDRTLVLLGFALRRRGSELVCVDADQLESQPSGQFMQISRTKTNRLGEPEYVSVPSFPGKPLCLVRALDAWLLAAKITSGPIFMILAPTRKGAGTRMQYDCVVKIVGDILYVKRWTE